MGFRVKSALINIRNTPRSISKKLQTNIPKAPDQNTKSPGPLPKKPQIQIQKCVTRHSRENRREGRVGIGIGSRANRIRSFFIETCFLWVQVDIKFEFKERISKNWISKNWISKNCISKNWISKNWVSKNWVSNSWISKNWVSKNWVSKNWFTKWNPRGSERVCEAKP